MTDSKQLQIAVTGSTGFVGKNVRKVLHKKGANLFSISRKNFLNYKSETKIISPDINIDDISKKIKNCHAFVHLIGIGHQSARSTFQSVNVELTKKIIKLCQKSKIKKIIYISGLGVSKNSTSAYFISKFQAEQAIINSGLDYTILRASYIIGTDDHLTKNLKAQIKSKQITIPGSGKYHLQPIFVDDVGEVIYNAITSKKFSNKIIELVGPETVTFQNYVRIFRGKSPVKIKHVDLERAYHDALHNTKSRYGLDDLNIMIGDFTGSYARLKKLCGLEFKKFREVLQSRSLSQ
jgi:NADH dehydrogenase